MKRIFSVGIVLVLLMPSLSIAQTISMKSLAASQLYLYGQATYDRGDYAQAATIFSRILYMDPTHTAALKTAKQLKNKGYEVFIPIVPEIPKLVEKQVSVAVKAEVPADPNADLKQNILQADEDIEKIRKDVVGLRSQINSGQKDELK